MKKLYIGKTQDGFIRGVLIADNKDLATAYFIGTDDGMPYEIEEIDFRADIFNSLPLFKIISSYKMPVHELKNRKVDSVIINKR